ncbi:unnamed protein product [Eruca vesicaria subsp. sativa]|uniref:Uncharacterized protein n=1 Tax=Eruca vesicaria subsp. sativa TaxID=29727 RepID=A0ABC8KXQ4_ERUVS|nr:unnamed protein product [Eruca vesicaria subsp. sativa]
MGGDGSGGRKNKFWTAVGGETNGVLDAHDDVFACNEWLALLPSSLQGKDTLVNPSCSAASNLCRIHIV